MMNILYDDIKRKWNDFFDEYDYNEEINKLRAEYPDERSIYVSFKDISSYDDEFASDLLKNPSVYLSIGDNYVKEITGIATQKNGHVNIRLTDIPDIPGIKYGIRNVRAMHRNSYISITGIIRKSTEVLPRYNRAAFKCPACGEYTYVSQETDRLVNPQACSMCGYDKGKLTLVVDESELVDTQKLEIQEDPNNIDGTSQPQRLTVIIEDDIAGKVYPGDRVTIYGILKTKNRRIGTALLPELDTYLYANNFRKELHDFEDITISTEDEKKIIELSKDPNIIDRLSESIAPSIYGLDIIKKTLVLQLFGGVRKTMADGIKIRGDIHILMVGDPGTAKSQLLKSMSLISPRSVFALGKGSSAAGLTAAAVRDDFGEGRWTLEAGALVLADKGFVAIDELDKMDQRDTSAMHEAMEQQTVTIAKAGIMATLNSRCSILAAANPKFGRYDPMKTIAEQIDFPPPLLSRFDIIFKLVDTPDKERDRLLASHILKENMLGEEYHGSNIPEIEIEFVPAIDRELIRKYVSYAKNNVFPKLSQEAVNILLNKYLESRVSSDGSVPITARQLESPIRLAEASARARLSNIIAKEDALLATSTIDYYLKDVSSMNGKVDIDILNTGISSSERHELEVVYETIKEIKANIGRFPDLQHVLDVLQNKGINNEQAMSDLERLKAMGQIYEPTAKKIDVIK